MMISITVVVGNPKPRSRTLQVATAFAHALLQPGTYELRTIDLAEHTGEIFEWPSKHLDAMASDVAGSDIVVFASPTYKATYTGLLKAFLDRYPSNGLRGVVAIPLLTGADMGHSMGPSVNLAPLLVELGAVVPGRGFYFVTDGMETLEERVAAAALDYARNIQNIARVSGAVVTS